MKKIEMYEAHNIHKGQDVFFNPLTAVEGYNSMVHTYCHFQPTTFT